jgi:WD40 repeat protein
MWAQFSRDRMWVVTASLDATARIWNAETGQAKANSFHHDGGVLFAEFSFDGRKVVTASQDKTIRLWDVESGQPLLNSVTNGGAVYFARFTSDGSQLFTASADGLARLWNSETGERIASFPNRQPADSAFPLYTVQPRRTADGDSVKGRNRAHLG